MRWFCACCGGDREEAPRLIGRSSGHDEAAVAYTRCARSDAEGDGEASCIDVGMAVAGIVMSNMGMGGSRVLRFLICGLSRVG